MKNLHFLLMMLASFSLLYVSSCKDDEKEKPIPEITLQASGGTELTLDGVNIEKDVIVTASEAATQDIVVSLTSNAAEGEATFASPTITIKQGEKSAVGRITFNAAKFPQGTPQKKITVTISTQTPHVTADVKTTDFLVKGKNGPDLIVLTIAGNNSTFNTTTGEQTLTVTATLAEAVTEDVSIAIAYDGTSDNLKELFKDKTALSIAKDQKTGTLEFKVGQGVEGTLKLGFTTANLKVDLQTKSLTATFAVDKNYLTITANNTTFNTAAAEQTMKVTATLDKALAEELDIAITYDGSTENMKALFGTVTSIKIAADAKTISMDFKVPQGTEGTLKMTFAIENTDATLKTTSLTSTFTTSTVLCATSYDNAKYAQVSGFTIGDKTITLPVGTPAYQDMTKSVTANITEGTTVSISVRNNDQKEWQDPNCHAWVDWNKDYRVTADEIMASDRKELDKGATNTEYLSFAFTAPVGTSSGTYLMRVGTNYGSGLSGCANPNDGDESRTTCDLTINYSNGTVTPEAPTFALINPTPGDIVVPATGDKEVTFNVTLSKVSTTAQTITLAAISTPAGKNGTLNPTSVTFAASETTKPVKIKFLSADFASDAVSASVVVTGTSTTGLVATTASITYNVKGTAEEPAGTVTPLCGIDYNSWGGFYTKQFTVGTYTSPAHTENVFHTDLTGSVTVNIKNGDKITIKSVNVESGDEDTYIASAWIDWNNNGKLEASELVMNEKFLAGAPNHETTSTKALAAPQGTKSGKYSMRIGSTYEKDLTSNGCGSGDHETFDFTDILVNYTAQ